MHQPNWFLAFPLPPRARWQEAAASAPDRLRRFMADDLHLTLAFLGPCGEERAMAAWRASEALHAPGLWITAGGWRALGPPQRPSAYGLTLAGGHCQLEPLLRCWEPQARQAAGLVPSQRPPLPHVTLLRPRRRETLDWLEPMRLWMDSAPLPTQAVVLQHMALYTWNEDRSQRLFRVVTRRPLG